jgi:putative phosphoesterase
MNVAIISDPHIPSRKQTIPDAFADRIRQADHVLHAGDFDAKGAFADQRALAPEMTAVHGNMDPDIGLPSTATVELGGVEFVITHGTGSPGGWEQRVANAVTEHATTDTAVGVAGHTHQVTDTEHDGIRILNPGSVTGANPADRPTMMSATAESGSLDVTVHEL